MFVLKLDDIYITDGVGDPPRSYDIFNAILFPTIEKAQKHLEKLKKRYTYRTFGTAKIVEVVMFEK